MHDSKERVVILREYLYVDATAVRGLLAQVESGVEEARTTTSKKEKKTGAGLKGLAEHAEAWGSDESVSKSLADSVFPRLEEALEEEGLLTDVSSRLRDSSVWSGGKLREELPAGRIVRVTAPGWIIDSRFIASMLTGFAVTHRGLVNMGAITPQAVTSAPPQKKNAQPQKKRSGGAAYKELPGEAESLEAGIPLGKLDLGDGDNAPMTGQLFRGIAQVARGMFTPGLHLTLSPEAEDAGAINMRLQEGRQYLDSDPDVLFSRYGVGPQCWTVVGTVGHHPVESPDLSQSSWASEDGVDRAKFAQYVTSLGGLFGNLGFADVAQAPGFSMVPWAVYRTLGSTDFADAPLYADGAAI